MRTYTARVTREGKWWMIEVPEIDGLTQARRLSEVEEMARSLISTMQDVGPKSFTLHVALSQVGHAQVGPKIESLRQHREQLAEMQQRIRRESEELAHTLSAEGVPVRDIGTALGVSHQRAQQLIDA